MKYCILILLIYFENYCLTVPFFKVDSPSPHKICKKGVIYLININKLSIKHTLYVHTPDSISTSRNAICFNLSLMLNHILHFELVVFKSLYKYVLVSHCWMSLVTCLLLWNWGYFREVVGMVKNKCYLITFMSCYCSKYLFLSVCYPSKYWII